MNQKIDLETVKQYLRVDYTDDDVLILDLIDQADKICNDITNADDDERNIAILYAVAYMYENRQDLDFNHLEVNLRGILQNVREPVF